MNLEQLNPLVKAAIEAMNARDRDGWYALFSDDAVMTDDGEAHDFREWSDGELFGESGGSVTAVESIEDDGRTLYARFHSDRWGDFRTFMKFQISGSKITRLDVGQA